MMNDQDKKRVDKNKIRCSWCNDDPLYMDYHDHEWGVVQKDDKQLFEMLVLEGAQAGLSWLTILKRRENYRQAFDHFNVYKVAAYGDADRARLLSDAGIIRHKLKINAAIQNARVFIKIQQEWGSFSHYLWSFVHNKPIYPSDSYAIDPVTRSVLSELLSADLKRRGMSFVGPTIMYAYMQSVGMINDHEPDCFLYKKQEENE